MTERNAIRVTIVQHEEYVRPGEYGRWAARHGLEPALIRCWELPCFPELRELPELLIVLGGPQSPATTKEECPHYDAAAEIALIRRCADAGKMVVGACLGAQLLGEAMGAPYAHSPERELGPTALRLTDEGRRDPFLADFPDSFDAAESHNDMPGLTDGCAVLARSEGCPRQIVRYGKYLYAFQVHLEFDREIAAGIVERIPDLLAQRELHPHVRTPEEILCFDYAQQNAMLSAFLDRLTEEWLRERGRA